MDAVLSTAPAPAPTPILKLILKKIILKKFIHFDAAPALAGALEPAPENK
jgi:hypothetical protein